MIKNTIVNYVEMKKGSTATESTQILKGEIEGANTYYHIVAAGEELILAAAEHSYHIIFMTDGEAKLFSNETETLLTSRSLYAAGPGQAIIIQAMECSHFFEVEIVASQNDMKKAEKYCTTFPIVQQYDKCEQYWDTSKTQKTINRIILEQENIPRFAMGSVESIGPDYVIPNNHPTVDQLFFTFEENETELIINDEKMILGGNILLHIPLGADHGSDVLDGKHMHYIWCDFLLKDEGVELLREEHIKTGEQRSF